MEKANDNGSGLPLRGRVRFNKISKGQFSDEFVVTVHTKDGILVGVFPSASIDKQAGTINAFIVKESDDEYLVDLPTHTFTTSSKVWFPKNVVSFEASIV